MYVGELGMSKIKKGKHASKVNVLLDGEAIVFLDKNVDVQAVRLFESKNEPKIDVKFEVTNIDSNKKQLKFIDLNINGNILNRVKRYSVQFLIRNTWVDIIIKNRRNIAAWMTYGNPIPTSQVTEREFIPYVAKGGKLKVVYKKFTHLNTTDRNLLFKGQLDNITATDTKLIFRVKLNTMYPRGIDSIDDVTLSYRGNDSAVKLTPEKVTITQHTGNFCEIEAVYSKAYLSENIYKDSYMLVVHATKSGLKIDYYINEVSKQFYADTHQAMRPVYKINENKKFLIQVALNKNVWIHYRDLQPLDTNAVREREAFALEHYKPNQKNGNILMFEKEAQMAQDNSFALFKHLQSTELKPHVFYVISENSPQRYLLDPWKENVLIQYSAEYYKHVIEDEMIVTSESLPHIYQFNMVYGNIIDIIRGKKNYFLQHGVIGIRKLGDVFSYKKSGFDYFNTSTNHEKKVVEELLKYPQRKINVLGLPRWADLTIDSGTKNKTLVYFPTWREYLAYLTDEQFVESEYFQQIKNVIEDEHLQDMLNTFDYTIKVFLHPKMRKFTGHFNPRGNIEVVDSSQIALNTLIKECDAVISDYSSMVWDFAYQRKPIILFQFDQVSYEKHWGGFFDKSIWEFGPVVKNIDELDEVLSRLFTQNMNMDDVYRQNIDKQLGELNQINEKHTDLIKEILNKRWNFKVKKTAYKYIKATYIRRRIKRIKKLMKVKFDEIVSRYVVSVRNLTFSKIKNHYIMKYPKKGYRYIRKNSKKILKKIRK